MASYTPKKEIVIHGHRGCRAFMPENTIPAFHKALELGVDAIELDVVCTGDGKLLVSHEPYFSSEICSKPDGPISKEEELLLNIYQMSATQAKRFRCGTLPHPDFPEQKQEPTYKPLLSDVVSLVKLFAHFNKVQLPIINMEIKTHHTMDEQGNLVRGDGIWHPAPQEYARIVCTEIESSGIAGQFLVQSFDADVLAQIHLLKPEMQLTFLTENGDVPYQEQLKDLGFKPWGFAPDYSFIDQSMVEFCLLNNLVLLAWTVNEVADMKRLMQMNVKHIITDYPDRAIAVRNEL